MSDPMGMPPGAMPPGGGSRNPTQGAIEKNRSMMNPTDASVMMSRGDINQNMTVRDFFTKFGVDVDGPVAQLQQFAGDQANKANPLTKMSAIANSGGRPGQPPMPQGRKPAVQSQGGLGGLMTDLGQ